MPLYGANGAAANNAPKNKILPNIPESNTASMYANVTPSAFVKNQVVGLYGVFANLATVANTKGVKNIVPGWVVRKSGMGPVLTINMSNTGTGYSNLDLVKITAIGCTNTVATVTTNSTGGIIALSNLTTGGGLFPNTGFVTVAITNTTGGTANGSNFAANVTLGGRAGRVQNETLVVIPSMSGNATQNNSAFPNA
jgi:hypothetical protein